MMTEVLPGLFHWYVVWPEYRLECYWLRTEDGSVLIDPLEGIGLDEIEQAGDCRAVIITSHWHERSALLFAKRTGAPIYVPEGHTDRLELVETYHAYRDGDALPGGLRAIWVLDECALLSELHGGMLFVGDALGTTGKWAPGGIPLGLHPRGLPPRTTLSPTEILGHLLDYEFRNLFPAHGLGLIGDGKTKVAALIGAAG